MSVGDLSALLQDVKVVIALALAVLGLGEFFLIKYLLSQVRTLEKENGKLEEALQNNVGVSLSEKEELVEQVVALKSKFESKDDDLAKFYRAREFANDEHKTIWNQPVDVSNADYYRGLKDSIPIMMFANLKGGVGKTTLATNLAAYFAMERKERVLLIDLDYQGSMSGLCFAEAGLEDTKSLADFLVRGDADGHWVTSMAKHIGASSPSLSFVPAFYPLEYTENRVMLQWLLGEAERDVRFNIAAGLLTNEVQSNFDRIILDGPPRMTTGLVQGLCTATHLFIPTVLDRLSGETIQNFASKIFDLQREVLPHLQIAGIIGTMTSQRGGLTDREKDLIGDMERYAEDSLRAPVPFWRDAFLPRSAHITNNIDAGIPFCRSGQARDLFKPIGDALAQRLPVRRES